MTRSGRTDVALVGALIVAVVAIFIVTDAPDIDSPNFTFERELGSQVPQKVRASDPRSNASVDCILIPLSNGERIIVSGYCPAPFASNWFVELPE